MGRFDCNKIQNILNDSKQKWTCWNNSSNNGTDEWTLSFIKAWGRFDWWLTTHWFSHIWLWICLNWNNLLLSLLPYCWSLHWLKRLVQHAEKELLTIPESTSSVWRASFIFFFPCLLIIVCFCLFSNCLLAFAFLYWFLIFYLLFFVRIKAYNLSIFSKTYLSWSSIEFSSFVRGNR
jgi:hypothetical protein